MFYYFSMVQIDKCTKLTVTGHSFPQVLNRSNIERIWKCTKTVMEILTFLFLGGGVIKKTRRASVYSQYKSLFCPRLTYKVNFKFKFVCWTSTIALSQFLLSFSQPNWMPRSSLFCIIPVSGQYFCSISCDRLNTRSISLNGRLFVNVFYCSLDVKL